VSEVRIIGDAGTSQGETMCDMSNEVDNPKEKRAAAYPPTAINRQ
jgi:hypothetical protein